MRCSGCWRRALPLIGTFILWILRLHERKCRAKTVRLTSSINARTTKAFQYPENSAVLGRGNKKKMSVPFSTINAQKKSMARACAQFRGNANRPVRLCSATSCRFSLFDLSPSSLLLDSLASINLHHTVRVLHPHCSALGPSYSLVQHFFVSCTQDCRARKLSSTM